MKLAKFALDVLTQIVLAAAIVVLGTYTAFILYVNQVLTNDVLVFLIDYQAFAFCMLTFGIPSVIAFLNLWRLCAAIVWGEVENNRIVLKGPIFIGLQLFRIWQRQNLFLAILVLCSFSLSFILAEAQTRTYATVAAVRCLMWN